ncbi:MAG: hypothetical protein U0793_09710 [Gemmataceae bacterium]
MTAFDPLDESLQPGAEATPAFKETLFARTRRPLRLRRWRRRLLHGVAAACLFGAGMAALAWLRPVPAPPPPVTSPPVVAKADSPKAEAPPAPQALEWRAFDQKPGPEKTSLLVAAGRKYLEEENDPAAAVRCYSGAVGRGGRPEVSPDDDWLIMALKLDRKKED